MHFSKYFYLGWCLNTAFLDLYESLVLFPMEESNQTSPIWLDCLYANFPLPYFFVFQWKRLANQQRLFKLLFFRKRKYLKAILLTLRGEKRAKIPPTTGLLNASSVNVKARYCVGLYLFSVWMHVYSQNIFRYNWCIQCKEILS